MTDLFVLGLGSLGAGLLSLDTLAQSSEALD